MYRFVLTIFFLIQITLSATEIAQIGVDSLFKDADFVGIVKVTEGHTLGTGDDNCGASYTGFVINQFRGKQQKTINFGFSSGSKVGHKYLVFLTKQENEKRYLFSTNTKSESERLKSLKRCASVRKGWKIMHSGTAELEYIWSTKLGYEEGFILPSRFISFPDSIKKIEGTFDERFRHFKLKWLRKEPVIQYLLKLK